MSKKHFNRLANELAIVCDKLAESGKPWTDTFTATVEAVVKACQAANPRFDAERFRRAVYEGAKGVRA